MKNKNILILALLTPLALRTAAKAEPAIPLSTNPAVDSTMVSSMTLRQYYESAEAKNEELRVWREDIRRAEARAKAAIGRALPQLSWEFNDTWQDPKGIEKLERKGFGGFVQKEQVESFFSAKQPLFGGLKEYSASSGFKREQMANALKLERAAKELFERTAAAFYAVVGYETDLENTRATLALAEDRLKDLRSFVRIGKARESEVFTAQARASALRAQMEQIQAKITSSREDLAYLAGQENLAGAPLTDEIASPPAFGTLEDAMRRAANRSDVRAKREEAEAYRYRIRYERGFYWPTADLTGKYYTRRATFMDDIEWDVLLNVRVPFFQGGIIAANVRDAKLVYQQALLGLEEMERRTSSSVRKIYGELEGAVRETRALEEAAAAAQKSYDALQKEYRLGLVTNLEVLDALDVLQAQKSARDAARIKAKLLSIRLNVATENL